MDLISVLQDALRQLHILMARGFLVTAKGIPRLLLVLLLKLVMTGLAGTTIRSGGLKLLLDSFLLVVLELISELFVVG